MSDQVYYKVLGADGLCCHGGAGRWSIDGSWMPAVYGGLAPCVRGYHLCLGEDLVEWLGPVIWTAEGRGKSFRSEQYHIFQEARVLRTLEGWNSSVARAFSIACAERAVPVLEAVMPGDRRVMEALAVARACIQDEKAWSDAQAVAAEVWNVSRLVDGAARDAAIAVYGTVVWQNGGMAAWAAAGSARSALAAAAWERSMAESKEKGVHPRDAERGANGASNAVMKAERIWQTEQLFALIR
ncbi:MAG: hypothetical protein HQM00_13000 [Magnetococcales bacterium]|nr:hypothetical protein [Magnetococcales bacterium]